MAIKTKSVRLPSHVVAQRYQLMLKPDLEAFTFSGEETIEINLLKPSKEITLHAQDLDIQNVEFRMKNAEWAAKSIKYNKKAETATFTFPKNLPKEKGELHIAFKGILGETLKGFYRSKYYHEGKEKFMATTQFEATDARRAFPCFDEPAHKAVFDVTLMIPGHTLAISNTIESVVEEHESGYKVVKFQPTPKMSTYLLAFIVGEFEWIEGKAKGMRDKATGEAAETLVRVFTTPGKKHQAQFALETAIRCLEFYNEYFGIPYPLPVMDLIAIPDFSSAAMENWGAVTYRETALLVDPENTSIANKQWVAIVIAHELAHQWFGNLVTMEWWTHLWLNEGFASYMEHFCVDALFPRWGIWNEYVSGRFRNAMDLDSLANTHPIEVEVHHPSEISEIFDQISYAKGSVVIRMLAEYIGHDNFREGLRRYLKKHAYANASTEDLWAAFEKVSKKPVRKIMKNWTSKPGYPLVKVEKKGKELKLSQLRYYSSIVSQKKSNDRTVWQVPIRISNSEFGIQNFLMGKKSETIKVKQSDWIKLNAGEVGLYKTQYPKDMLEALRQPVTERKLPSNDRIGVIRDVFALAESGQLSLVDALNFVRSYKKETDYTVWLEIVGGLLTVHQLIFGLPYHEKFKEFARDILSEVAARVGWEKREGEKETDALLRSLVLSAYGTMGDDGTLAEAMQIFKEFRENGTKVPVDLRSVVYNLAASNGGTEEYDFLLEKYRTEELHEEKERLARAMGKFKDAKVLNKTLQFTMSKDVRLQDSPFILGSVWMNPYGKNLAWEFVKSNWNEYLKRYSDGTGMLSRIIGLGEVFTEEEKAKDLGNFFKKNTAPGAQRTIKQTLEKIRSNVAWLKRDSKKLERFFS